MSLTRWWKALWSPTGKQHSPNSIKTPGSYTETKQHTCKYCHDAARTLRQGNVTSSIFDWRKQQEQDRATSHCKQMHTRQTATLLSRQQNAHEHIDGFFNGPNPFLNRNIQSHKDASMVKWFWLLRTLGWKWLARTLQESSRINICSRKQYQRAIKHNKK